MPAGSLRNLTVLFDDKFNFKDHIFQMCRTCYYHIRDLRRICGICLFLLQKLLQLRWSLEIRDFHNIAITYVTKLRRVQNSLTASNVSGLAPCPISYNR